MYELDVSFYFSSNSHKYGFTFDFPAQSFCSRKLQINFEINMCLNESPLIFLEVAIKSMLAHLLVWLKLHKTKT